MVPYISEKIQTHIYIALLALDRRTVHGLIGEQFKLVNLANDHGLIGEQFNEFYFDLE